MNGIDLIVKPNVNDSTTWFTLDIFDSDQFPIALNYTIKNIKKLGTRAGDYSHKFRIPGTANNDKNLGFLFNNTMEDGAGLRNKLTTEVRESGIPIFAGYMRLQNVVQNSEKREYEIQLFGSNMDWVNLLEEKTLRDYNWGGTIPHNDATITGSWTNTGENESYCYPFIHYGNTSGGAVNNFDSLNAVDFFPAIFIRQLVLKAFNDVGYAVKSNFFDADDTDPSYSTTSSRGIHKYIIPYTGEGLVVDSATIINKKSRMEIQNDRWLFSTRSGATSNRHQYKYGHKVRVDHKNDGSFGSYPNSLSDASTNEFTFDSTYFVDIESRGSKWRAPFNSVIDVQLVHYDASENTEYIVFGNRLNFEKFDESGRQTNDYIADSIEIDPFTRHIRAENGDKLYWEWVYRGYGLNCTFVDLDVVNNRMKYYIEDDSQNTLKDYLTTSGARIFLDGFSNSSNDVDNANIVDYGSDDRGNWYVFQNNGTASASRSGDSSSTIGQVYQDVTKPKAGRSGGYLQTFSEEYYTIVTPTTKFSYGISYDIADILPDEKFLDHFRGMIHAFDLYIHTDPILKVVSIEPRRTWYNDLTEAKDWSSKVDLRKQWVQNYVTDYLRELEFDYKDDPNDGYVSYYNERLSNDAGMVVHTFSERFPEGRKQETNPMYAYTGATHVTYLNASKKTNNHWTNGLYTARMGIDYFQGAQTSSFSTNFLPRLLDFRYQRQRHNDESTDMSWVYKTEGGIGSTATKEIKYEFPSAASRPSDRVSTGHTRLNYSDTNGLLDTYYSKELNTIEKGVILQIPINLSHTDIKNFSFKDVIYLDVPELKGYYGVQRIKDYQPTKNLSTTVILEKLEVFEDVTIEAEYEHPSGGDNFHGKDLWSGLDDWANGGKDDMKPWISGGGGPGSFTDWNKTIDSTWGDGGRGHYGSSSNFFGYGGGNGNANLTLNPSITSWELNNGSANYASPGQAAFAGGFGTIALGYGSQAMGIFNAPDPQAAFVVGAGESRENRFNAITVRRNGVVDIGGAGDILYTDSTGNLAPVYATIEGDFVKVVKTYRR